MPNENPPVIIVTPPEALELRPTPEFLAFMLRLIQEGRTTTGLTLRGHVVDATTLAVVALLVSHSLLPRELFIVPVRPLEAVANVNNAHSLYQPRSVPLQEETSAALPLNYYGARW